MIDFYNAMELNGSTIGNHEWDFGKNRIIEFINNSNFPYIVANLERKKADEIT